MNCGGVRSSGCRPRRFFSGCVVGWLLDAGTGTRLGEPKFQYRIDSAKRLYTSAAARNRASTHYPREWRFGFLTSNPRIDSLPAFVPVDWRALSTRARARRARAPEGGRRRRAASDEDGGRAGPRARARADNDVAAAAQAGRCAPQPQPSSQIALDSPLSRQIAQHQRSDRCEADCAELWCLCCCRCVQALCPTDDLARSSVAGAARRYRYWQGRQVHNNWIMARLSYLSRWSVAAPRRGLLAVRRAPSCHHATRAPTFVDFSVYKGRAAMQIKPIPPTWRSSGGGRSIERDGVILIEAAAAGSQRDYDWSKKQVFALSVLEIGKLLTRGREELTFVHDPNKGRVGEGSTVKTFKLTRMSTDSKQTIPDLKPVHMLFSLTILDCVYPLV
eukprot:COSAG02_NODE_2736_length_8130_cov_4.458722_3_plen_389_part_00